MKPVHNRDLAGTQNLKMHSQLWLTGTLGTEQPTFKKKAGQQTGRLRLGIRALWSASEEAVLSSASGGLFWIESGQAPLPKGPSSSVYLSNAAILRTARLGQWNAASE